MLQILNPNQYSAVSKSSTTQALIHIVHHWSRETNDNGATVIVTLFYYQKAFDLIDHKILVSKLCKLSIPTTIIDWITDFFSDRFQRIKLSEGCYSECGSVPSGIAEVMGSNPVESPEFFSIRDNCLNCPASARIISSFDFSYYIPFTGKHEPNKLTCS